MMFSLHSEQSPCVLLLTYNPTNQFPDHLCMGLMNINGCSTSACVMNAVINPKGIDSITIYST